MQPKSIQRLLDHSWITGDKLAPRSQIICMSIVTPDANRCILRSVRPETNLHSSFKLVAKVSSLIYSKEILFFVDFCDMYSFCMNLEYYSDRDQLIVDRGARAQLRTRNAGIKNVILGQHNIGIGLNPNDPQIFQQTLCLPLYPETDLIEDLSHYENEYDDVEQEKSDKAAELAMLFEAV